MACERCGAGVPEGEWQRPTRAEAAKATLADVRTWVIAFAVFAGVAVIAEVVGVERHAGAGAGAAVGMILAGRMLRLRKCPRCDAVV